MLTNDKLTYVSTQPYNLFLVYMKSSTYRLVSNSWSLRRFVFRTGMRLNVDGTNKRDISIYLNVDEIEEGVDFRRKYRGKDFARTALTRVCFWETGSALIKGTQSKFEDKRLFLEGVVRDVDITDWYWVRNL